jgi:O-antigen/teichoic acid export membrane protein
LDSYSLTIRRTLLYSLVGAAISLVTALVFHVPVGRTIVAMALAMVLIFSGFLLRSFVICHLKGKRRRIQEYFLVFE